MSHRTPGQDSEAAGANKALAMRQPPTGIVTFLFTDIEGSARLWEQRPDAMRSALARHDELLSQSIEQNGGFVFKTVGDAFCAAFATAPALKQGQ